MSFLMKQLMTSVPHDKNVEHLQLNSDFAQKSVETKIELKWIFYFYLSWDTKMIQNEC